MPKADKGYYEVVKGKVKLKGLDVQSFERPEEKMTAIAYNVLVKEFNNNYKGSFAAIIKLNNILANDPVIENSQGKIIPAKYVKNAVKLLRENLGIHIGNLSKSDLNWLNKLTSMDIEDLSYYAKTLQAIKKDYNLPSILSDIFNEASSQVKSKIADLKISHEEMRPAGKGFIPSPPFPRKSPQQLNNSFER